ncbi:hypothetical protein pb186bvf_009579 [Paramecium bursaria]
MQFLIFLIYYAVAQVCPDGSVFGSNVQMNGRCVAAGQRVSEFNNVGTYEYLVDNYCADLQSFPISCIQYRNTAYYDQQALSLYRQLHKLYSEGTVTADCLGIGRQVLCSQVFNYCEPSTGQEVLQICQFLCDLFNVRCGKRTDITKFACTIDVVLRFL